MPYIKVNISQLQSSKDVVNSARIATSRIKSSFYSIGNSLDWDVKACSGINRTISQINNDLANEVASMQRMVNFFDNAIQKYKEVDKPQMKNIKIKTVANKVSRNLIKFENNIVLLSLEKANGITKPQKTTISKEQDPQLNEVLKEIIAEAGFVGAVISILKGETDTINYINNREYAKAMQSFTGEVRDVCKAVPKIYEKVKKLHKASPIMSKAQKFKSYGKVLIGADNYFDDLLLNGSKLKSTATKWTTRAYNNLNKLDIKKLGNVTKCDVIISGILNIIRNTAEYYDGQITAGRAVAETIGETAIDIAVTAGLYTVVGVSAAIVASAAGVAAVPTIVVTGIVLGIKLGLDALSEHFTGKNFVEFISDEIIDAGEWIGNTAVKAYNAVAPKVKNVVNNIKSTASNVLGNVRNGVNNFFGKLKFAF